MVVEEETDSSGWILESLRKVRPEVFAVNVVRADEEGVRDSFLVLGQSY
jgi:hypothetical protein